jgi:hypothetical protein
VAGSIDGDRWTSRMKLAYVVMATGSASMCVANQALSGAFELAAALLGCAVAIAGWSMQTSERSRQIAEYWRERERPEP